MSVSIDLAAGEVRLADATLVGVRDASAVVPGALRLEDGSVVRPLDYATRASLCGLHGRPASLARAVLEASSDGAIEPSDAHEALALHLAGGASTGTQPGFAEVAFLMSRVFGWSPEQLATSAARYIDGLATSVTGPDHGADVDSGWTRLAFSDGVDTEPSVDVTTLRDRLARDLLERAAARLDSETVATAAYMLSEFVGAGGREATVELPEGDRGSQATPPRPIDTTGPRVSDHLSGGAAGPNSTVLRHRRSGDAPNGSTSPTRDGVNDTSNVRRPGEPVVTTATARLRADAEVRPLATRAARTDEENKGPARLTDLPVSTGAGLAPRTDRGPAPTGDGAQVEGSQRDERASGAVRLLAARREVSPPGRHMSTPQRVVDPLSARDVADEVAASLDDESDLRGILPW